MFIHRTFPTRLHSVAHAEEVLAPQSLTWLIVGDRAQIESQVREMGLGEVRIMDVDGNLVE